MNPYESYALALDVLRAECSQQGLVEFMPPATIPGFAHHPHMHATVDIGGQCVILPYQLSLHNRIATHYLNRPSFCVGPCFRNDEQSPFHGRYFTQFSFEIFSHDLNDLTDLSLLLLRAVCRAASVTLDVMAIDLLSECALSDAAIRETYFPQVDVTIWREFPAYSDGRKASSGTPSRPSS